VFDGNASWLVSRTLYFPFPSFLYFLGKDETRGAYRLVVVLLTSVEASIARGQAANDMEMMQIIQNFKTPQEDREQCRK
jgi:hypothetical protein